MTTWTSRCVVPLSEAEQARQLQARQRIARLTDLADAADVVADLLVARNPALEIQRQTHLDFFTVEVRQPGSGRSVTLMFQLIDTPLRDLDLKEHTETEREEILKGYQDTQLKDGRVMGAEQPEMMITVAGRSDIVKGVNPLSLHNHFREAEEELDGFLLQAERLV